MKLRDITHLPIVAAASAISMTAIAGVSAARDVDDQMRYTAYIPCHHDVQMEMGFNFYSWGNGKYDFKTGKADIPPEAIDRACPSWKELVDFPADRIVDDDYPLLKYYRWFWQYGDGWARTRRRSSRPRAATPMR